MPDTDELSAELRELRDAATLLAVPAPRRIETITAHGRRFQRRRRFAVAGASVAGATAAAALTANLVGGAVPAAAPSAGNETGPLTHRSLPARIQTAAFTLVSNDDGTVTLTINPYELFEPTTLENDLAKYGIPALVTPGKVCSSDPAPPGISQVESWDPGSPTVEATITIDPSAMPAGSELSFGTLDLKDDVQASYSSLIDPNAYTCSTDVPTDDQRQPAREGVIRLNPSH